MSADWIQAAVDGVQTVLIIALALTMWRLAGRR